MKHSDTWCALRVTCDVKRECNDRVDSVQRQVNLGAIVSLGVAKQQVRRQVRLVTRTWIRTTGRPINERFSMFYVATATD